MKRIILALFILMFLVGCGDSNRYTNEVVYNILVEAEENCYDLLSQQAKDDFDAAKRWGTIKEYNEDDGKCGQYIPKRATVYVNTHPSTEKHCERRHTIAHEVLHMLSYPHSNIDEAIHFDQIMRACFNIESTTINLFNNFYVPSGKACNHD